MVTTKFDRREQVSDYEDTLIGLCRGNIKEKKSFGL